MKVIPDFFCTIVLPEVKSCTRECFTFPLAIEEYHLPTLTDRYAELSYAELSVTPEDKKYHI